MLDLLAGIAAWRNGRTNRAIHENSTIFFSLLKMYCQLWKLVYSKSCIGTGRFRKQSCFFFNKEYAKYLGGGLGKTYSSQSDRKHSCVLKGNYMKYFHGERC
ncbi:hypothetical protein O6H91_16G076400 [Diphasiastrum complanatum]|uniref:Uncharacterized protein n=1 Tax=Diphasiastrum complanatum TaxID=34168 RepID=A0ACC2BDU6_DIPCM|nr:hypothetical protein O6H91_16G076400 [Diphasiastrum complanatum]